MNILIDKLPEAVEIDGAKYPINTDFRTGILYERIMTEEDADAVLKGLVAYYGENLPPDIEKAIEGINWFRSCGKEERSVPGELAGNGKPAFFFECDADVIYADFMSQYRIDLTEIEYMHWWKFKALLAGLSDHSKTTKRMEFRTMKTDKLPKEQKRFYQAMQRYYEIREECDMAMDELDEILLNGGNPEDVLRGK